MASDQRLEACLILIRQNRAALAEKEIGRILAEDPENQTGHEYMAWALAEQGRLKEALNRANNAIRLDPQDPQPYYVKATCYRDCHQPQKSLRWFRQAIRLDPEVYFYHSHYSDALYSLGRYQDALREAKKALKLNPQGEECHNARTKALMGLKRDKEAFASVEKTLALEPENAQALHLKGQLLLEDMEWKEAERAIRESLRIQPVNWKAELDLGTIQGQKIARWPGFLGLISLLSFGYTHNAASIAGAIVFWISACFCETFAKASGGRHRTALMNFTSFLILLGALDVAFFYNADPWYHDWAAWALGLFFTLLCANAEEKFFNLGRGINFHALFESLLIPIFLSGVFSRTLAGLLLAFNGCGMFYILDNWEEEKSGSWFSFWGAVRILYFPWVVFLGCFVVVAWQERQTWLGMPFNAWVLLGEILFILLGLVINTPDTRSPLKEVKINQTVETKSLPGGSNG